MTETMTALNTLQFMGFTLRPASFADMRLATLWTEADAEHCGRVKPEFWVEQRNGVDSYLMEDGKGPVFFFKVMLCTLQRQKAAYTLPKKGAEVHIQFMPVGTEEDAERTRTALTLGLEWLEPVLEQAATEEIFFDSGNEKLIGFATKRLGFCGDGVKRLNGERRLWKRLGAAAKGA